MKTNTTKTPLDSITASVISRRSVNRGLFAAGFSAAGWPSTTVSADNSKRVEIDYVIVGAGAGGGPCAARLAQAGYTVALLDAGLDPEGSQAQSIDPRTGLIYQVPALAGFASEDPLLSWAFFVQHYANLVQQQRDSKYVPGKGIYYPRGSCLGGSTAHNAMLFVYPTNKDWDDIATLTGDSSWRAHKMRRYFERIEACQYCEPNAPDHGFSGYIPTSLFDPQMYALAPEIKDLAEASETNTPIEANDLSEAKGATGSFTPPMHTLKQVRVSIREHLTNIQQQYPDKLFLLTGALATKIILRGRRAIGVKFMRGANLYEADTLFDPKVQPAIEKIYAKREVILSAGVYNTPQLLKLSGIGPKAELNKHNIELVVDLPGVGANLQDRYEVSVNVAVNKDLSVYNQCMPAAPSDPCLNAWFTGLLPGAKPPFYGPYANNANYNGRIFRSDPSRLLPDLFIAGQVTAFNGFFPGYSQMPIGKQWTLLILKAHNNNTAGTVTLRSTNPRQMPEIIFRYFEEGNDSTGQDLAGIVQGVKLARSILKDPKATQHLAQELHPGPNIQTDAQIIQYVRDEAWGHHASCTAKIGVDSDPMAVLDSRFRVRGVRGLRVVDISSFPRLPGYFPVAAVMMIGEKAADTILEEAEHSSELSVTP
jgi:choline dehydrogenase